jgi:hypothetical protein
MYLQSIKSVKHNAAKSVNRSILKKSRHIGFGVFVVHSSMIISLIKKVLKQCCGSLERQDSDRNQCEKQDPDLDPHQSQKADPELHQS